MKHADHWFLVPNTTSELVTFPETEALHAAKVLRLQEGDGVQWLDGRGGRFVGRILVIDKRTLQAKVEESSIEAATKPTILAVGQLHDASRLEWLVEKATELGVSEIALISTSRVERTRYKLTRLESKIISAVKQSGRAWVPQLRELSFAEALEAFKPIEHKYIAHCYKDLVRDMNWLKVDIERSACLFIGPEGDFTREEVEKAEADGYQAVALGKARLRTETAAIAGLVKLRSLVA